MKIHLNPFVALLLTKLPAPTISAGSGLRGIPSASLNNDYDSFVIPGASLRRSDEIAKNESTYHENIPKRASSPHDSHRRLQTSSCLTTEEGESILTPQTFTGTCTVEKLIDAVVTAMANNAGCAETTLDTELFFLLGGASDIRLSEPDARDGALKSICDTAFRDASVPFGHLSQRGDQFDREFMNGGSDWNDEFEVRVGEDKFHVLKDDADRIMVQSVLANAAGTGPIEFPSYITNFQGCSVGAAMCCYVSDRQSNDSGGMCDDTSESCYDSDPTSNTDVCYADMSNTPVSTRVKSGFAVYDFNTDSSRAEGNVHCHGFAWDSFDEESPSSRYKGNLLFDVAFKQGLYDKGYTKNVPGAPMCGCIEQMPIVERADCTKISSVSETWTVSLNTHGLLQTTLTDSTVEYGPCDAEDGLKDLYKTINAANYPGAIDNHLVGEGNCGDAIDTAMNARGYKRSELEIEDVFSSTDSSVSVQFSSEVDETAANVLSYKIVPFDDDFDVPTIVSATINTETPNIVTLTTSEPLMAEAAYDILIVGDISKRVATMVKVKVGTSKTIRVIRYNELSIGNNFRISQMYDVRHLSISSPAKTSQIFRDDGTVHPGPRNDYNAFSRLPTYSDEGPIFGDQTIQIDQWRIRQIDETHLSISSQTGNVARIYRSDGTIHGRVNSFSGWQTPLGDPSCAFITDTYLQVGDWRIGEYDSENLSVGHRSGKVSIVYRADGTRFGTGGTDFNTWEFPHNPETVLQGSTANCIGLYLELSEVFSSTANDRLVTVRFNSAVSDSAKDINSYKIYDTANPSNEVEILDATLASSKDRVVLSTSGSMSSSTYNIEIVGSISKFNAARVMLTVGTTMSIPVNVVRLNELQIGTNFKWAQMYDVRHFSVSSSTKTAQIFRSDGTSHPGPRNDYNAWTQDATSSDTGPLFGETAVEIGQWRIRQIDATHMSVSHQSGNVARIYRSDGTVHGRVNNFSGWRTPLGNPSCAFITDKFLQIGDWRIGEYDSYHMSVSHRNGKTSMIYRADGHRFGGPRTDFNTWDFLLEEVVVLHGTTENCGDMN